jgi:hypothetical protein
MVKFFLPFLLLIGLAGCASSFGNSDMSQYKNKNSFQTKGKIR